MILTEKVSRMFFVTNNNAPISTITLVQSPNPLPPFNWVKNKNFEFSLAAVRSAPSKTLGKENVLISQIAVFEKIFRSEFHFEAY